MKWYSVELINENTSKVIIYKENLPSGEMPTYDSIIAYCFIENNYYVKGYCDCLQSFGYEKWNGWR